MILTIVATVSKRHAALVMPTHNRDTVVVLARLGGACLSETIATIVKKKYYFSSIASSFFFVLTSSDESFKALPYYIHYKFISKLILDSLCSRKVIVRN